MGTVVTILCANYPRSPLHQPASTTHRPNVGPASQTGANIDPTLDRCLVLAGQRGRLKDKFRIYNLVTKVPVKH